MLFVSSLWMRINKVWLYDLENWGRAFFNLYWNVNAAKTHLGLNLFTSTMYDSTDLK